MHVPFSGVQPQGAHTSGVSVCMFEIIKKCVGILNSLDIIDLHQVMYTLKLKINVYITQYKSTIKKLYLD